MAAKVGVAAPTTVVEVAEAAEARIVPVVKQEAVMAAVLERTTEEVVAAALGRTSGRRDGTRGRSYGNGTSSSFSSSAESSTDLGEVAVVTCKRQVTPSLVDVASPAECLRKMTVIEDRVKPVFSDLARAPPR